MMIPITMKKSHLEGVTHEGQGTNLAKLLGIVKNLLFMVGTTIKT